MDTSTSQISKINSDWLNLHIPVEGTPHSKLKIILFSTKPPSTTSSLNSKYPNFNLSSVSYPLSHSSFLFYTSTQFIAQNDLLSANQQPHVLCRVFAQFSTNSSARNSLWSFYGTNGHPNASLAHNGSDAKRFQRTSNDASTHHGEPTRTMQMMMKKISDHVGMSYPVIPDSRFVAQSVDENPITIDEDEGFSETMTPQNTPPQQPPAMEPRPALRSIEILQNSSTARQLFD